MKDDPRDLNLESYPMIPFKLHADETSIKISQADAVMFEMNISSSIRYDFMYRKAQEILDKLNAIPNLLKLINLLDNLLEDVSQVLDSYQTDLISEDDMQSTLVFLSKKLELINSIVTKWSYTR